MYFGLLENPRVLYSLSLSTQKAAHHPEVSKDVKSKALQYGSECTTGYVNLLEQVLQVGMRLSHLKFV